MPYVEIKPNVTKFQDTYNSDQKQGESLQQWYRRLAKVADQRIVRLKSYSHDEHFKGVLKWAYSKAQEDIKHWSGEHAERFNTKPPDDPEQLIAKINDIRSFLAKPTSSKAGIISVYQKKADTINEKFGAGFTWQTFASYFENENNKNWDSLLGSGTALETIGELKKHKKKVLEELKKTDRKSRHVKVDDEMLQKTVDTALQAEKLDIASLL